MNRIRVMDFGEMGRGVEACVGFDKGDVIEEADAVFLPPADFEAIKATSYGEYLFVDRETYHSDRPTAGWIIHGAVSHCNHEDDPNAELIFSWDRKSVTLIATRRIYKGEQVRIFYADKLDYADWRAWAA